MKELEAVNMLLRLIGSSPINSLQTPHPDAANAKTTLRRVSEQLQQTGWWFNLDYNVDLVPDSNDEIKFGSTIIGVKTLSSQVIQRGDKLYDRARQTYKFYSPVKVERLTRILDWDDLPATMQTYCTYFAGAEFIRDELEDASKQADLQTSASRALVELRAQDLDEGQYNMYDKHRVRRARYGVQPYLGRWY